MSIRARCKSSPAFKNILAGEVKTEKLVIVINGAGGVGKDTLIGAVADKYKTRNISSVDPIKAMARMAGWDGDKSDKSRKMLSDLKMLFIQYNDLCLRYITEQYHQFLGRDEQVLFVHIREPEEIARFVAVAPKHIKTLLIYRSGTGRVYGNPADDNVFDYHYDITFENSDRIDKAKEGFLMFFGDVFRKYSFETETSKTKVNYES